VLLRLFFVPDSFLKKIYFILYPILSTYPHKSTIAASMQYGGTSIFLACPSSYYPCYRGEVRSGVIGYFPLAVPGSSTALLWGG
jgi:hypothetical protein